MNATERTAPNPVNNAQIVPFTLSNRIGPRERDFGIGYGKSSGYAATRRYTNEPVGLRFRVA